MTKTTMIKQTQITQQKRICRKQMCKQSYSSSFTDVKVGEIQ